MPLPGEIWRHAEHIVEFGTEQPLQRCKAELPEVSRGHITRRNSGEEGLNVKRREDCANRDNAQKAENRAAAGCPIEGMLET